MKKCTKKDKRRMLIWSLIIVILLSYLSVFSFNYWSKILENRKETKLLSLQYEDLLKKEEELNSEVTKLQDPEYVAKYAREKYYMTKDDEVRIKIEEISE